MVAVKFFFVSYGEARDETYSIQALAHIKSSKVSTYQFDAVEYTYIGTAFSYDLVYSR